MSAVDQEAERAITNLLSRFFLAFDERDWDAMATLLAPEVFIDYASSGREEPSAMSGSAFVARRRGAVDDLAKQHSYSNLLLSRDGESVTGRCNYLILRFAKSKPSVGEDFYHSCGSYRFSFQQDGNVWQIKSITQHALRSWGNSNLHGASAQRSSR
jgi:hypothetical protein